MNTFVMKCKRVMLTRVLSVAWEFVYGGRYVARLAERLEGAWDYQLRTRVAWGVMTFGEHISAQGEDYERIVERWAAAWQVAIEDVVRPLLPPSQPAD
jgi:hypothetical protein